MTIDKTLTTARAIEEVGDIVPIRARQYVLLADFIEVRERWYQRLEAGETGVEPPVLSLKEYMWEQFPIDPSIECLPKGVLPDVESIIKYDIFWHFGAGDQVVVARQQWTDAQRKHGMYSREAIERHYSYVGAQYRTNMVAVVDMYREDMKKAGIRIFGLDGKEGLMKFVYEALMNAVEHGSNYGQQGRVSVRMLGGQMSIAFFVDDPGKHDFMVEPVDEAYRRQWEERANAEEQKEYARATNSPPYVETIGLGARWAGARGLGLYRFTTDQRCLVNSERIEGDRHRIIILWRRFH
jgi:hypothetical protein